MADAVDDFLTGKTGGGASQPAAVKLDTTDAFLTGADATTTKSKTSEPELFRPETWRVPQDPAAQRVRDAAYQAFIAAPSRGKEPGNMSVLPQGVQDWTDRNLGTLVGAVPRLAGTVIGGVAAAGAAGAATVNELLAASGMDPRLQRDLNMVAAVTPVATGGVNPLAYVPKVEAAGPKFAPGVRPMDPAVTTQAEARGAVRNALGGPEPPASPTGIEGVRQPPAGYVAPTPVKTSAAAVPTTSDDAKTVASSYYRTFDRAAQDGGSLTPQATNKFIANVEAAAPKPGIGQAVAGKNPITDLVERLQPYKDRPMSLEDAQVVDKQLGNLISAEYGRTGVSDIGRQLQAIQHDFRDQLSTPAIGDVVSGQAGLDALAPARKAYSQAMKMDTVERMRERAEQTLNPTTSFQAQVRTFLSNDRLSRGWTDEEKAALRAAADRGAVGTVLHIMGSRLVPIVAGGAGASGGLFGSIAAGATAHVLGEGARSVESTMAARRMQNALTVLGKGVPPKPGRDDIPTATGTATRPTGESAGPAPSTGLAGLGGAAQAIGANLRDMLWDKLQRGDTTELGRPSQILIDAKAAMDQGAIKSRADFDAWTQQWGARQRAARNTAAPPKTP